MKALRIATSLDVPTLKATRKAVRLGPRPLSSSTARASSSRVAVRCEALRSKENQPEDVGRFVEEAAASSGGLFNDSFKAALQEALHRNGARSLLGGPEREPEDRVSATEEVLTAAITACKANLMKLKLIQAEAEKALEVEAKQLERLQFARDKARSDAAFYRSLQLVMADGNTSD